MADLASTDLTITPQANYGLGSGKVRIENGKRKVLVKIQFGNGALTYPAAGVPLPSYVSFGMVRNLAYLTIVDQDDSTGILWKYDYDNKKLRGYIQGAVISAAGAATLDDYALDSAADPTAAAARQPGAGVISLGLGNTTAAGTIFTGQLKELQTSGHAPAAQVLYAEAVGW